MRTLLLKLCSSTVVLLSLAGFTADDGDRRLVDAVERHDRDAVRAALQQHADVNAPQPDGATALAWAVHWGETELIDVLIRAGANVNAANDLGVTPLALACENGSAVIIENLLRAGADPNVATITGETALMTAARTGNLEAVKLLVEHGSQVNAKKRGRGGQTALMWAVAEGHLEVSRALIEAGADVNARSTTGFTPLLFTARSGDASSARLLLSAGARVDEKSPDGSTALTLAINSNHPGFAIALLEQSPDLNVNASSSGYAALHSAVQRGYVDLVKILLERGADPNARVSKTPALVFGANGGAGRADLIGATPVIIAARAVDAAMMATLVAGGADPLLTTKDGTTALMVAAGLGQVEDATTKHSDKLTSSAEWEELRAVETVRALLRMGLDVNGLNSFGNAALHGAAYVGANAVAQLLVDNGADLDAQDVKGQTAFRIAEGHQGAGQTFLQYPNTVALLRTLGANTDLGIDARTQFLTNVTDRR
jgi:ankyrin repeat protein